MNLNVTWTHSSCILVITVVFSKEVLDKLNNVNNPSSLHTYDFYTLYTNLPLDLVRSELFEMIDRYFDINERKSNKYVVLIHFWETAQFASLSIYLDRFPQFGG